MSALYFLKRNPVPGSSSLTCEACGLEELRRFQNRHGLNIPEVLRLSADGLCLEKIDAKRPHESDWEALGVGLAKLHQVTAEKFGFESDNFIGLNPQKNVFHDSWGEFFCEYRLMFQVKLIESESLRERFLVRLERKRGELIEFLNAHKPEPSLLHGDLWSGNVMFGDKGPWLIDPAVYYGDREADLAMTKMFGSFSSGFYKAYEKAYPLPDGHETRERIYNLYHYLNHLNLFGHGYLSGVEEGMRAIESIGILSCD